ncbi:Ig heavy chain V region 914, partial [Silurus meridionalis]
AILCLLTLKFNIIWFYSSLLGSYGQSLTSTASVVKRPGESVTVSCTVFGFSMSSYNTHWIRQKPGRGLEWIGYIDGGTGTGFAQSLQGQFSITKDTNKNILYLEVKSLKAEDTAVYYCARESH